MRYLIFFLLAATLAAPAVSGANDEVFETFIKSRDVIATVYFPVNSDKLPEAERERVAGTIQQLRKLQTEGRLIRVEGFSSPEGDKETNFLLSFFRARDVADLIETKGLPAEIALTGYGDLQARSDDPLKERRVEIVSYVKPPELQKVRVAGQKNKVKPASVTEASDTSPGLTRVIDSLTVDQAIKNKLADKQKQLAEKKLSLPLLSPGISQVSPDEPIIDALTIEQAIMEKIGAVSPLPSGAVSQVDADY